jgi:peptidoglycan/xylan/chitin deacetylase (PgdA/CDA1 family)
MSKIVFLHEGRAAPLHMWIRAADFWKLSYEIMSFDTFLSAEPDRIELIAWIDQPEISDPCREKVERFVKDGGKLLLSGSIPESFAAYFGDIEIIPLRRAAKHRCIRIAGDGLIGRWKDGEILFFANSYHCAGRDYLVKARAGGIHAACLGQSCEMAVTDEESETWGEWSVTENPTLLAAAVGAGKVLYTPLCLGEMEWVVQPRVPTFRSYPYVAANHGILMLMRDMLAYLLGPEPWQSRPLWPGGARCAVVLSGDVHDYTGIPGRANREHRDMIDNMNILREYGLDGKATFFISGAVVKKFPAEIREAMERGYEICPHTYQDTCYDSAGWGYREQMEDVRRCIGDFTFVAPETGDYRKGFRTHGYNGNYDTRLVLEHLGYDYLADMQAWEMGGGTSRPDAPDSLVTYTALPQQAADLRGRKLNLLEIPDTVANDHFVYRIAKMQPEEALAFYKGCFDRIYRLGGLFQTCWHPYVSLKEDPSRERVYREMIAYMASHPDVVFLRMKDLCRWWKDREQPVQFKI